MMRLKVFRLLAAVGSALAMLVYPAALSAADGKPTRVAIPDGAQSFDFPAFPAAFSACGFELAGSPVSNNQYIKTYPADANGNVRERITGSLKEEFANAATGKSIVVNVSGPGTLVMHPDHTADLTIEGSVPVSYLYPWNPRGPATYIYTGRTVFSIDDDGTLTLVSTTDKQPFDVCAALS